MDGWDIAQEIRIERKLHKGAFLLLEGETDYKRIRRFCDEHQCSVVITFGRDKLEEAIELLEDEGFPGIVGLADADFDRCGGATPQIDNVIYSEFHDFDVDWMAHAVVDSYLAEFADAEKCKALGGTAAIIDLLMRKLEPLSALRHINHNKIIRMKLDDIDLMQAYDGSQINVEKLVIGISRGKNAEEPARKALEAKINGKTGLARNWKQFTNGHDMCAMLGIMLQGEIGSRKTVMTYAREVAAHIRLAFSAADFCGSRLSKEIERWEIDNAPYVVLSVKCDAHRAALLN